MRPPDFRQLIEHHAERLNCKQEIESLSDIDAVRLLQAREGYTQCFAAEQPLHRLDFNPHDSRCAQYRPFDDDLKKICGVYTCCWLSACNDSRLAPAGWSADEEPFRPQHAARRPKVFLSHNWKDKEFVRRLSADLRRSGAQTWVDEAEINVGEPLLDRVRGGIDSADYFAVVLSANSANSNWVQREIKIATEHSHIRILPILIDNCDMPEFLAGMRQADFRTLDGYQPALRQLLRVLKLPRRFNPVLLKQSIAFLEKAKRTERHPSSIFEDMSAREAGLWLIEKLTPVASKGENPDCELITVLEAIVDEVSEDLLPTDGDWLIQKIEENVAFENRFPGTGCVIKVLAKLIKKFGTDSKLAQAVRNRFIEQASYGFEYDPKFNKWVRQRESDLYTALETIGDEACKRAMRRHWPDGYEKNAQSWA